MYRYIIRYKRLHGGDSPSRREIASAIGLPSVSMVQHHLLALESAGRITRPKRGKARMIAIPGAEWRFSELPESDQNKCALCGVEEAADLPEGGRKVG